MNRKINKVATTTFLTVAAMCMAFAETAMAQDEGGANAQNAGKALGDLMRDLAEPLVGGLAGLMALGSLVSHNFPKLLGLAGMVILIMLFLVPNTPLVGIGKDVAAQIGAGSGAN